MVNMVGFEDILNVSIYGLMNFLVFILLIVTGIKIKKKELEPNCKKGFSKLFITFLIFLMFSTFFDLAYFITAIISDSISPGMHSTIPEIDRSISDLTYILWGVKEGLVFLNLFIGLILIFTSMEVNLFNKKSKWKFGIIAIILLCGAFLLMITKIILHYILNFNANIIISLVVSVLTNFNYILIAVFILILLKKTSKDNESLKVYTKPLSAGIILLFIIRPLILPIIKIIWLVSYYSGFVIYEGFGLWIILSLFYLASLIFLIGIILLAKGALKTMNTPLTFSREKGSKGTPQKGAKTCSKCGAPIPPLAEFCTNCGHHS